MPDKGWSRRFFEPIALTSDRAPITLFLSKQPETAKMTELCHDPRISSDPEYRIETNNPALIAAEYARRAFPDREMDWHGVGAAADLCEAPATISDVV